MDNIAANAANTASPTNPSATAAAKARGAANLSGSPKFTLNPSQTMVLSAEFPPVELSSLNLPLVHLSAEELGALQNVTQPADPGQNAAQNDIRAFSLVKDAGNGDLLGGVWPKAGTVEKGKATQETGSSSDASLTEETQQLAKRIAAATGRSVTIQYFMPGDTSAPTFGETAAIFSKTV